MKEIYKIKSSLLFLLLVFFQKIFSQVDDDFTSHIIEENTGSYLIDVNDYNKLNIFLTTSNKIYFASSLPYTTEGPISVTGITTNQYSMAATYDNNYLLIACLNEALLAKIKISDGQSTILLNYNEINYSGETLKVPTQACFLSIYDNIAYISFPNTYESENKTYINFYIIKQSLAYNTDGPILGSDRNIFKYDEDSRMEKMLTTRQICCDVILYQSDTNENRVVCLYEKITTGIASQINGIILKNDFSGIESIYDRIAGFGHDSGFNCFKYNDNIFTLIMRKQLYNMTLQYSSNMFALKRTKCITFEDSQNNLIYFTNNIIFFVQIIHLPQFTHNINFINMNTFDSSNYYRIYDYTDGHTITNLIVKYDENSKTLFCIYHLNNNIKYFSVNNEKINNIFYIDSYSKGYQIISNSTDPITLDEDFIEKYGTAEIQFTKVYKESSTSSFQYKVKDRNQTNFPYDKSTHKLTPPSSNNYWYEYNFAYIFDDETNFLGIFYLDNVMITLETCAYQCSECTSDYSTCIDCRNDSYAKLEGETTDNNCYPVDQYFEGYIYDSENKIFKKCYSSCSFCYELVTTNPSSQHECKSCAEGYYPSYEFEGNCYKINVDEMSSEKYIQTNTDGNFSLKSCSELNRNFKIYSTGECISSCPTESIYYSFTKNEINFSEQNTIKITEPHYEFTPIPPPKYSFNGVCYIADDCPTNTLADSSTNKCKCQQAWHQDLSTEEITCYSTDYCINTAYKYYYDDTKECKQNSDNTIYYQFNFQEYKKGMS